MTSAADELSCPSRAPQPPSYGIGLCAAFGGLLFRELASRFLLASPDGGLRVAVDRVQPGLVRELLGVDVPPALASFGLEFELCGLGPQLLHRGGCLRDILRV